MGLCLIVKSLFPQTRRFWPLLLRIRRKSAGSLVFSAMRIAAKMAYFGLYALQHRGQESAGIAVGDGYQITSHKNMGLVHDIFTEETT